MKRRLSSQDSEQRWKTLLTRLPHLGPTNNESNEGKGNDDPFECHSVALPPTHDLVEGVLQDYMHRWDQLDHRRVIKDPSSSYLNQQETKPCLENKDGSDHDEIRGPQNGSNDDVENDEGCEVQSRAKASKKRSLMHKGGWRFADGRLRLPQHFDYATKRSEAPDNDEGGDRVVSLWDPTRQLSYHQELWKLFASVPKVDQIEKEAWTGGRLDKTMALCQETKSSKLDHHFSRLRMSDRHGLPSPLPLERPIISYVPSVRLECWRRQLKRGTSPDCDRLVLEFSASHTLLDVHQTIVHMAKDDLWNKQEKEQEAGCFFIENSFYTTGPVDYAGPIIDWIDGNGKGSPNPARRNYLGIVPATDCDSSNKPSIKSMHDTPLKKIPFRLGVRYYHVFHGDVETAIVLVDRRLTSSSSSRKYPLIHDAWGSSYPMPFCDVCRFYPAMYVTATCCEVTDGGPRLLCENCRAQLKISPESVMLHSIWRDQTDLSGGVAQGQSQRVF